MFEHFTKFRAQALGRETRRIRQQLIEARTLQCGDAELGQDFLLLDPLLQGAQREIRSIAVWLRLHHRLDADIGCSHGPSSLLINCTRMWRRLG